MPEPVAKATGAFRTIGEVSRETGVSQHILRFWEARFPQLRPMTRAGQRRYYRPDDVALVRRIDGLLNRDGYSVRGVQRLLAADRRLSSTTTAPAERGALDAIRDALVEALATDALDSRPVESGAP